MASPQDIPRATILLIEDRPADIAVVRDALAGVKNARFELAYASRLSDGLTRLAEGGIDVVLLDLMLPDCVGLDTFVQVRTAVPELPIVVLTGLDDEALALQTLQRGAQDYLVKSQTKASPDLLWRAIRYAIERNRLERLKDDFLSTVSHELRTPLATVKEFAELLSDQVKGTLTAGQQEYLAIIKQNVSRLVRIINDLLDMSKIEAGRLVLTKGFVEVQRLVEQVVGSMRPLAEGKQIRLETQLPEGPLGVFAEEDKAAQVLVNIVGNAIKFTPLQGRVTVRVQVVAKAVQFSVEDTGIGISPEHLPALFEKFQQFEPIPDATGSKGTGLGLAISKRLVELHGGRIWAESQPGSGSTFHFTLPAYIEEEVFKGYLKAGIARAKEKQGCLSLIMLAVVDFGQIKARHGPAGAAQLLKEVEEIVHGTVRRRAGDIVVRWQEGEVVVILAEVEQAASLAIAQRVQQTVGSHPFRLGQAEERIGLLVSSATHPDDAQDAEGLLQIATNRIKEATRRALRILVVDDEIKVRQLLQEILERRGFTMLTAGSGQEALAQLHQQSVDLILLDLLMPEGDGYEVYYLLKENPHTRDIPVLVLTAKGERADRRLGMPELAPYHYLTKPFQVDELLAKIREILPHAPRA